MASASEVGAPASRGERLRLVGETGTWPDPLVQRAAGGDRTACHELLCRLYPRIRNLVRYLVRTDQDLDDLTQDAVVAVLRGLSSYRAEGAFTGWLDRVVVRAVFAGVNRRRARVDGPGEDSRPFAILQDDRPSPDEEVRRVQLVRLLDELTHEQRSVLVLHHVLGMTVPEIASTVEVPIETVRSRLRVGKARLREIDAERRTRGQEGRR